MHTVQFKSASDIHSAKLQQARGAPGGQEFFQQAAVGSRFIPGGSGVSPWALLERSDQGPEKGQVTRRDGGRKRVGSPPHLMLVPPDLEDPALTSNTFLCESVGVSQKYLGWFLK